MKSSKKNNNPQTKLALTIIGAILLAGLLGWWLGNKNDSKNGSSNSSHNLNSEFKSLISYHLPSKWIESICGDATLIVTTGMDQVSCGDRQYVPIKITIDETKATDCGQMPEVPGVQKRTCKSVFIDGHKSLQTETVSGGSTTAAYYIDAGPEVVKIEYIFTNNNQDQSDFDQMVKEIKVKA